MIASRYDLDLNVCKLRVFSLFYFAQKSHYLVKTYMHWTLGMTVQEKKKVPTQASSMTGKYVIG
jgi:hypothetical protein